MEIIKALTDDQIRTAILIGITTGKTVGGYTAEDLTEELAARTAGTNRIEYKESKTTPRPPLKGMQAAAEYLGCSLKTVDRNLEQIPHYKLGRSYFFTPEELDRIKGQGGL